MPRKNFVLFFPDEMSASTVSCYGNPFVEMPNYDRVARQGVRFEHCVIQNPVCAPSRCATMTGRYPHVNGHRTLWNLLEPSEPSLFRYLKQQGYEIAWFGKNHVYNAEYMREIMGKESCECEGPLYKSEENAFGRREAGFQSFLYNPLPKEQGVMIDENISQAVSFLRNRSPGDPPFFLFLPISMPHPPYSCPYDYYNRYDPEMVSQDLIHPSKGKKRPEFEAQIRSYRQLDQLPQSVFEKIHAVYLGSNAYVDFLLGKVDEALHANHLENRTTLILSSDHGDWHGNRGLVEKWPSAMDDDIVRVPLIVRDPDCQRGHVVAEQVELFDIMPTVLELAGIKAEHTHFAQSLCPQLAGEKGNPDRLAYCEGGYDAHEPHCFEYPGRIEKLYDPESIYYPKALMQQEHPESVCRTVMVRSLKEKLVYRSNGQHEFYNLCQDPEEQNNRYGEKEVEEAVQALQRQLLRWFLVTGDAVPVL